MLGGDSGPITLDEDRIIIDWIGDLTTESTTKSLEVIASKDGYITTTTVYDLSGLIFDAE